MYRTYRPSGKTAWYFFLLELFALLVLIPVGSGLCLLLIKVSPGTMWEVIALLVCKGELINLSCRFCMDIGRVRNTPVAWITGILNGLLFWYLLFVYGAVLFTPEQKTDIYHLNRQVLEDLAGRFWETLRSPGVVLGEWIEVLERGASIRGNTGRVLFTVQGLPLAVTIGILCILTALFTGVCFYVQSKEPFCERTKRWCGKTELHFAYVANPQNFLHRLLLGDLGVIRELEPLREVNTDYALASLYSDEEGEEYYISIENMRRKAAEGKNGTPSYESEEIAEYVLLDRENGRQLLLEGRNRTDMPVAEVDNRKIKLHRTWRFLWRFLVLAAYAMLLLLIIKGTELTQLLHNGVFLFYTLASGLVGAVNFLGSFGKRYVVKLHDEEMFRRVRQYEIEREGHPSMERLFYLILFLVSFLMFWLCIRRL